MPLKNFPKEVTILIPTHRREAFLIRALEFYRKVKDRIVVADSSAEPCSSDLVRGVDYRHFPDADYTDKMQETLASIETEFLLLAPDDDFVNLEAVRQAGEFMKAHPDYGCVQGWHVAFHNLGHQVNHNAIHAFAVDYAVEEDDPLERIRSQLCPYMNNFYSLHRTEIWQKFFFDLCPLLAPGKYLEHYITYEITQALHAVFWGKHKILPVFWIAKEYIPDSGAQRKETPMRELAKTENFSRYKELLTDYFTERSEYSRDAVRIALDEGDRSLYSRLHGEMGSRGDCPHCRDRESVRLQAFGENLRRDDEDRHETQRRDGCAQQVKIVGSSVPEGRLILVLGSKTNPSRSDGSRAGRAEPSLRDEIVSYDKPWDESHGYDESSLRDARYFRCSSSAARHWDWYQDCCGMTSQVAPGFFSAATPMRRLMSGMEK